MTVIGICNFNSGCIHLAQRKLMPGINQQLFIRLFRLTAINATLNILTVDYFFSIPFSSYYGIVLLS